LLSALLIALFASRIGRGVPLKTATITHTPDTVAQHVSILSQTDTEARLVLAGAASSIAPATSAALAGGKQPRQSVSMLDVTPMPPISHQDAASWLPAPETTTEALSPLPTTPGRQFPVSPLSPLPPVPVSPVRPMRPLYLPARPRQTDALPRRTILMPTHSDPRIPVTANSGTDRPGGLLSRYRNENHPWRSLQSNRVPFLHQTHIVGEKMQADGLKQSLQR